MEEFTSSCGNVFETTDKQIIAEIILLNIGYGRWRLDFLPKAFSQEDERCFYKNIIERYNFINLSFNKDICENLSTIRLVRHLTSLARVKHCFYFFFFSDVWLFSMWKKEIPCFFFGRPLALIVFYCAAHFPFQFTTFVMNGCLVMKEYPGKSLIGLIKERSDETAWMRDICQSINCWGFLWKHICHLCCHQQTFRLLSKSLFLSADFQESPK